MSIEKSKKLKEVKEKELIRNLMDKQFAYKSYPSDAVNKIKESSLNTIDNSHVHCNSNDFHDHGGLILDNDDASHIHKSPINNTITTEASDLTISSLIIEDGTIQAVMEPNALNMEMLNNNPPFNYNGYWSNMLPEHNGLLKIQLNGLKNRIDIIEKQNKELNKQLKKDKKNEERVLGWECSSCGVCYSPVILQCECKKNSSSKEK